MISSGENNPYESLVESDFYQVGNRIDVYLGKDSVTRRTWEYEQKDFLRYVARHNPLGFEKKFLEERGRLIGESIYDAFDDVLEEELEAVIYSGEARFSVTGDPAPAARQVIMYLDPDNNPDFYSAALEAVEEKACSEVIEAASEI